MADRRWVIESYRGGQKEIRLGRLAEVRGQSAKVRNFAKEMVIDHTRVNLELRKLADAKGIDLGSSDPNSEADYNHKLKTASRTEFDELYKTAMLKDHQEYITAFEREADRTSADSNLSAWARKTLPGLKHHLQMAQNL
jgi:putative membrane protein